ncbi:M48 family metalloprotease [Candidatus Puniceispirillum marinum]|uniref:Zn-dependent protease n=1 Tax=Puniceispirillum marinum (strain IMCC1322) TaxID=488538 RepID=D5BSN2_PUNMI|nr:M48 family metalloprotease [Candidatus Puniceispirillum marinum]ADE39279.1 Putative Zn-dependent protease [Candidatus Puniceispirillum marinum IMCC1322]
MQRVETLITNRSTATDPITRRLLMVRSITIITAMLLCLITSITSANAYLIRDTELEAGLEDIISPLAIAAGFKADEIKVRVVIAPEFNAFVAGGRTVYINSGLILKAKSPDEVIGVLAHELGHIVAGHVPRRGEAMADAKAASALAALAAIALAAGTGSNDAAVGVMIGGQDRAQRNLLASVRRDESVADELGLQILDDAGYSALGLRDMMQRMASQRALPESRQSSYYTTHPGAETRLTTYQDHVNQSAVSDNILPGRINRLMARLAAKMRAWTENPQDVLRYEEPDPVNTRYGHAIASYRRGDLGTALNDIDALIAGAPDDAFFYEFRGDILLSMGRASDAASAYETAVAARPDSPQILLNLGRALIATNQKPRLERAIEAIEKAASHEPEWAFVRRQLAIAYGRSGRISYADMSLAEEALLTGDTNRAVHLSKRVLARKDLDNIIRNRANDILFRYGTKDP